AGVPAEAAEQPWQAEVEQAEAEWEPPVWRIASGLFAAIALIWIVAAMVLSLGITGYSAAYSDAWSTAGLLSPLAGWVAACVLGLLNTRVRRIGRWFTMLLLIYVTAITLVVIGFQIMARF